MQEAPWISAACFSAVTCKKSAHLESQVVIFHTWCVLIGMPVTHKDVLQSWNSQFFFLFFHNRASIKRTRRRIFFFRNQLQGDITAVGGFYFSSSSPCDSVVHVLAQEDNDDSQRPGPWWEDMGKHSAGGNSFHKPFNGLSPPVFDILRHHIPSGAGSR